MTYNLQELFSDYKTNFANKTVEMQTNYKSISCINIKIEENNFPHLLGLHYCVKGKSATQICTLIEREKLTYEDIKKQSEFGHYGIKERIKSYNYLSVFLKEAEGRIFYPTENLKQNTMKLTLVFSEKKGNGEVVLGVRKDVKENVFRLATLHYSRKQKFTNMRSSKIISVNWY